MRVFAIGVVLAWCSLAAFQAPAAAQADPTVSVMILGSYHMSNPDRDLHNMVADDVLAPKRQAELTAIVDALAAFHPTLVAVEGSAERTGQRFQAYLTNALPPEPDERVQIGFRLAQQARLATVYGIDVQAGLPFNPLLDYAKSHGKAALLKTQDDLVAAFVQKTSDILAYGTIADTLRFLNDPQRLATDNAYYRTALMVGDGKTQPGVELVAAWYRRNLAICGNLVQRTKPGDHAFIVYGAGHALLLRQCIQEMPGFVLVEPNDYLPQ
jgi:Family of unknown function (DUF5694)